MRLRRLLFLFVLLVPAVSTAGDRLSIAVASNFAAVAHDLAEAYSVQTGIEVRISIGSTGKLYNQIVNGAPFDAFLAADVTRPVLLEKSGRGLTGTRRTYAVGTLVFWSRDPALAASCPAALDKLDGRLAIANPETAPYGYAAVEYLKKVGRWDMLERSLVYGENASQALQFAASGNAQAGFVAASHILNSNLPAATCTWPVPEQAHTPLEQQAIVVASSGSKELARDFVNFLGSDDARQLIAAAGYRVPGVRR